MGGYGSGRWGWHSKADTVDDCRILDACRWSREGILRARTWNSGTWGWYDENPAEPTASLNYEADTRDDNAPWVRLCYTLSRTKELLDYRVQLTRSYPHFGGVRWWFTCGLVVDGRKCNRRVAKLYLSPGGRYYGCRHCYRLTYRSAQEHDKRFDWLRRNPESLDSLIVGRETLTELGLMRALMALGRPER
jgi:hypothetical protein